MTSGQGYGPDHTSSFGFGLHQVMVAIPPDGEDRCRGFYVGLLGMLEPTKPPALAARGGPWSAPMPPSCTSAWSRPSARLARRTPASGQDLDGLAAALVGAGIEVSWDESDFPGHRRFHAADPVGNRLESIQRDGAVPIW
ncbi:VOC family protein [Blastococcus atacamensis]|uniref:hypothetical protein n=1 Tax=Blastococcus atacamensis TaxID=2070508 RepID=UPI001E58CDA6|nr:hypothetical protein [Blastococcus atacamensis]